MSDFDKFTVVTAAANTLRYYEVEAFDADYALAVAKVADRNDYPQSPSDFHNCVVQRGQNLAEFHIVDGD